MVRWCSGRCVQWYGGAGRRGRGSGGVAVGAGSVQVVVQWCGLNSHAFVSFAACRQLLFNPATYHTRSHIMLACGVSAGERLPLALATSQQRRVDITIARRLPAGGERRMLAGRWYKLVLKVVHWRKVVWWLAYVILFIRVAGEQVTVIYTLLPLLGYVSDIS